MNHTTKSTDPMRSQAKKEAWERRKARPKFTGEDEFAGLGLSDPGTKKGALQRACLKLIREHKADGMLPTSIRFLYYELEMKGAVERHNRKFGPASEVSEATMTLRKLELVSWNDIEDETRTLNEWYGEATVAAALKSMLLAARLNPWIGSDWSDTPPLILCESRSLAGVLRSAAYSYGCAIAATNGQVGGFLRTDIAPALLLPRPVRYLGDFDLAGGQIEENTRNVLEDIVGALDWERVAITEEQVDERELVPVLKKDKRYVPARTHEAWETEALGQATVIALVEEALEKLLPTPLDVTRERERKERVEAECMLQEYIEDMDEADLDLDDLDDIAEGDL